MLLSTNQIITKEIEVNEWKKKYEETRAEVFEMRFDLLCSSRLHHIVNFIGQSQECTNIVTVSELLKLCPCHPHRKIVAEYEKTVAQMIGELVPPSGHRPRGRFHRLEICTF